MITHKHQAAHAQRNADIIGWIDGIPIPRQRLDDRLAALRGGPRAGALPAPGTSEDRQLIRWTAQVIFTEELCRQELSKMPGLADPINPTQLGEDGAIPGHLEPNGTVSCEPGYPDPNGAVQFGAVAGGPCPLDPISAVQLGSINTAAWQSEPAVGVVFRRMFAETSAQPAASARRRWWRVSYAVGDGPLSSLGWTTLGDLPAALADALRTADIGVTIGPIGGYYARIDEIADRPDPAARRDDGDRLREFARWLDLRRSQSLIAAEGFEHPGDPSQPDNTHRH